MHYARDEFFVVFEEMSSVGHKYYVLSHQSKYFHIPENATVIKILSDFVKALVQLLKVN